MTQITERNVIEIEPTMKISVLIVALFSGCLTMQFLSDSPIIAFLVTNTLHGMNTAAVSTDDEGEKKVLTEILTRQTTAWNQGDLQTFMQTYWKSDELTFSSGGKTTRGWQATLDNYVKGYAPPKEMGHLNFDHLEISLLNPEAALILGHWHLKMSKGDNRDGNFSLVVKKIDGQWKIIHDHSSSMLPAEDVKED